METAIKMPSLIFTLASRPLYWLMLGVSVFILYRGHNEPGGGFVGGLIAASGFAILTLAHGVPAARSALRLHPIVMVGIGLTAAFASGLPGLLSTGSFLKHIWVSIPLGVTKLDLGTALLFDIGVYLVVLGGVLAFLFRLYEESAV